MNIIKRLPSREVWRMSKPNCYKCKHRGTVCGSVHSSCNHPSLKREEETSHEKLMNLLAKSGRVPACNKNTKELNIKGSEYGISKGWFNFPSNFDPVWLENCDGFEEVEGESA